MQTFVRKMIGKFLHIFVADLLDNGLDQEEDAVPGQRDGQRDSQVRNVHAIQCQIDSLFNY